jgi:hypothetical protein
VGRAEEDQSTLHIFEDNIMTMREEKEEEQEYNREAELVPGALCTRVELPQRNSLGVINAY